MMEPLGESQVLSYLYKLSNDYEYYLISLEKPTDLVNKKEFDRLEKVVKKKKIHWIPVKYKTSGVGKFFNFFNFTRVIFKTARKNNIKYIHSRSYLPTISAYLLKKTKKVSYLFDTRGFAFDERADVGSINRNGFVFKLLKKLEKSLYTNASGINKLSYLGKKTILNNKLFKGGSKIKNIEVIPTCVNLDRFEFHKRSFNNPIKIGYIGTAIGWYDFDKTMQTLSVISKTIDYNFLVFNGNQHKYIKEKVKEYKLDQNKITIEKVPFEDMPIRLKEIDVALFYIHPYFSKKASAATKLGELFASGIPVLTNKDVGDHQYYIENYKTGKILDFNKIDSYNFSTIFNSILNEQTAINCRMVAEKYFSLDKGVDNYKKLYKKIFL